MSDSLLMPKIATSHSARVRGLKLRGCKAQAKVCLVALRASAWIETRSIGEMPLGFAVALRASAWIETFLGARIARSNMGSQSARVRGLKLNTNAATASALRVALRASAWIETGPRFR